MEGVEQQAIFFALILTRVSAFIAAMPLFSAQGVPRLVRASLALALAVFWYGSLTPPPEIDRLASNGPLPWLLFSMAIGREVLLGAVVGLMFSLFLAPIHIAGELITSQVGLAQASLIGGATNTAGSPLTVILETLAGMLFVALDMHHVLFGILHHSFVKYPLGGTVLAMPVGYAVGSVEAAQAYGVLLAAPMMLALFLVTTVLAIMGRVAPQLNIYSVGFTAQALVAIGTALYFLPDMLRFVTVIFSRVAELVRAAV